MIHAELDQIIQPDQIFSVNHNGVQVVPEEASPKSSNKKRSKRKKSPQRTPRDLRAQDFHIPPIPIIKLAKQLQIPKVKPELRQITSARRSAREELNQIGGQILNSKREEQVKTGRSVSIRPKSNTVKLGCEFNNNLKN